MSAQTNDEMMLFCVRNKLADARVTELIPCRSEALALFGFCQFLEGEVQRNKLDKRLFELIYCGTLTSQGHIDDAEGYRVVASGGDALESFEALQQELFDKEASL